MGVLSPPEASVDEADEEGHPDGDAAGAVEQELAAGEEESVAEGRASDGADPLTESAAKDLDRASERVGETRQAEDDDFELAAANAYRPSTMAVTTLLELPEGSSVTVDVSGGRYVKKPVRVPGGERTWWLRKPVSVHATFAAAALLEHPAERVEPTEFEFGDHGPLKLEVIAYPRKQAEPNHTLVTICLVNRSEGDVFDELCLFQSHFSVEVQGTADRSVLPYPDPEWRVRDEEEESLALVYRSAQTFAVGHGCAADWTEPDAERARTVSAEALPVFEAPNISADIWVDDERLEVSMAALAGLKPGDDGSASVEQLLTLYASWIEGERKKVRDETGRELMAPRYTAAADRHLGLCDDAVDRIRDGLSFLDEDEDAALAFKLANHAVLLQQLRVRREPRRLEYNQSTRQVQLSEPPDKPDPLNPPPGRGSWRPFQIAFLLSCVRSVATDDTEREAVELIWFPTGGGKTEAYLALTAYSLFYRRLKNPDDSGVDVLMRYTLRLLTAQQFQRASALICAMEHLRRQNEDMLGHKHEFSIGLWLGGSVSPNRREDARVALQALKRGEPENKFVIMRCPWCGAQMGPFKYTPRGRRPATEVAGYTESDGTVVFKCPDAACDFSDRLPFYVIDDDIYDDRPSLVIGTVDKFAQLAWEPRARSLFGIAADGSRSSSAPNLIIQDELHLISGPLGSMVGIFEAAVGALCSAAGGRSPKIVSSTATIRRYEQQVRDLYARDRVHLFPPRGIDAADSFFAHYARDGANGPILPGRKYVGIHASGLGSVQTAQVRTFSALLQAPATFPPEERDPWWTLMVFFNSLRELGTSLSLLQSDIPDYLWALQKRFALSSAEARRLRTFLELTGRLRNDEVPKAMEDLEVETTSRGATAVDVCLASNIIEVGIDIDRLSLMCVVGQPKTTSQYIQVTGRVGRKWWERPALVATIYSPSKPRDRSHFEKFRSYHERLYAQVEPTSVTPFAPPVVDRALHAVIAAYVRQAGTAAEAQSPHPFPDERVQEIRSVLEGRVEFVDSEEQQRFAEVFERRVTEWARWQRTDWRRQGRDGDIPLLRQAGAYASAEESQLSWATPNSLRDVDAECETKITTLYLREDADV